MRCCLHCRLRYPASTAGSPVASGSLVEKGRDDTAQRKIRGENYRIVNLPGECWAEIQELVLVRSSSSLHPEACNALGASDGVIHSSISFEASSLRAAWLSCRCCAMAQAVPSLVSLVRNGPFDVAL